MELSMEKKLQIDQVLRGTLEKEKISLKDLASAVDIAPSTIHGWLNGVPPKSISDVKKVADFLNLTTDELCFNESPRLDGQFTERILGHLNGVQLVLRTKE